MKSFTFNNVFLKNAYTCVGPVEGKGPLKNYFNKIYDDLYLGQKCWEDAESKLLKEAILGVINKSDEEIDLIVSGDLINQNAVSSYAIKDLNIPYIGAFGACSTMILSMIIGANIIESKNAKNVICATSSHNCTSERQFRNPTEYGGGKPKTATFTVTGGAACQLSEKGLIKITRATVGKIFDSTLNNPLDMGSAMAPAACETLLEHLRDFNLESNYYDLILTGDLSDIGFKIVKDILTEQKVFNANYYDAGLMVYDIKSQKVFSGGSGCACIGVVSMGYIKFLLENKKLKRVLLIGTGALMNQMSVNQKKTITSIAHAIALEGVEI